MVLFTEISDQTFLYIFSSRFWSLKSFKTLSECESRIVGRSPNFANKKVVPKGSHQEECVRSAKTTRCVAIASFVASQVLQVTVKFLSFPSKAEFSQVERKTSKPNCRLDRAGKPFTSSSSNQTQREEMRTTSLRGAEMNVTTSQGQSDNFFPENEGPLKALTAPLVSQLHAREKWRRCGSHNYQR